MGKKEGYLIVPMSTVEYLQEQIRLKNITAQDAFFYMWMKSFAFKSSDRGGNNPFTVAPSKCAKLLNVSVQMVKLKFKALIEIKLINPIFQVKDQHGKIKQTQNIKQAQAIVLKYKTTFFPTIYQVFNKPQIKKSSLKKKVHKKHKKHKTA